MKAFLLVFFSFASIATFAQSNINIQLLGHPRLLVTKDDIIELKKKYTTKTLMKSIEYFSIKRITEQMELVRMVNPKRQFDKK
jgi:hypothetical protein